VKPLRWPLLARFNLRRQLQVLIALGAVLAVVAVVALASAVRQTRQLEATHKAAVEMASEMTGLLVLTQEYLLHGEPRPRDQWRVRYRRLQDAYAAAQGDAAVAMPGIPRLPRPEQLQLLPTLFEELQGGPAAGSDLALWARRRELAVDRLLATGQALAENAYDRERALSERRIRSARRTMALALASTGALGLLCLGLGVLIARRVLSPLRRLQEAVDAASGSAPSAAPGVADELGALADRMEGLGHELARRGEALAEREALLRLVVDHVPAMIGYWDREGRNRLANADYQRWFGKAPAEIEGRPIAELLGPGLYAKNRPFIERALAGERQEFERTIPGPDGVSRHSHATYVPDLRDGRVQGFVALVTDVTRRVRDEQALAQALAERDTLLKEVYHRVKNNLQVVLSLLRLQGRGLADEAARDALADAAERVRAMALVHEQLMESPDGSHVSLARYVPSLVAQLAAGHGCDAASPVRLLADAADTLIRLDDAVPLGLLLTELVVNSLKHAFPDGRAGSVTVRVQPNEDGLFVAAIDDGCGLPLVPAAGGATLGRQLAAGLAAQLGGELRYEATPGGGTTAWLQVPFRV
jgi:PAS domain S-box-containing protein